MAVGLISKLLAKHVRAAQHLSLLPLPCPLKLLLPCPFIVAPEVDLISLALKCTRSK